MCDFRKLAHLQEQLGPERFAALIDSANTGKIKQFCDTLVKSVIPTELTVGDRTYDILGFLREGETSVVSPTMVERAKEMSANLGEEDGQYLLNHQEDIPVALRGKVVFVFTGWRDPDVSRSFCCVSWGVGGWTWSCYWFGRHMDGRNQLLRRKQNL